MLDLKQYERINAKMPHVSDLIAWHTLAAPGVVRCKDESLIKLYRVKGVDVDSLSEDEKKYISMIFENAVRPLAEDKFTVAFHVVRKSVRNYLKSEFKNPIAKYIDDVRKTTFENGMKNYINIIFFSISWKPKNENVNKLLDIIIKENKKEAFKNLFSRSKVKEVSEEFLNKNIAFIEEGAKRAVEAIAGTSANLTELKDEELMGALNFLLNPAKEKRDKLCVPEYTCLDQYLTDFDIDNSYHDGIVIDDGFESQIYKVVSIKEFPHFTAPGCLDELMAAEFEFRISETFALMGKAEAKSEMESRRSHYKKTRKKMSQQISDAASAEKSELLDVTVATYQLDAENAMEELEFVPRSFGNFNIEFVVWDADPDKADKNAETIVKILNNNNYIAFKETMHKLGAYMSSLPGNDKLMVRKFMMSLGNYADISPIRTVLEGDMRNDHLKGPALTVLDTVHKTPFYFNLNVKDVGFAAMFGPTGAGKSVMLNFLSMQFQKYNPRTFIFDQGYSSYISCKASGGLHLNFRPESFLKINPFKEIGTQEGRFFAKTFLETLITAYGEVVTVEEGKYLQEAIELLSAQPKELHYLGGIYSILPQSLKLKLYPWVEGEYRIFFNNIEDELAEFPDYVVFEMKHLSSMKKIIAPLLMYLFYKIEKATDGIRPVFLIVDEVWFALDNVPGFKEKFKDWLATKRKMKTYIFFATQSLNDAAKYPEILAAIIDNVPTKIFLPNQKARTEAMYTMYTKIFGLTDTEYDLVTNGIPKREYVIKQELFTRLGILKLEQEIIAFLASDDYSMNLADYTAEKCRKEGKEEWYLDYLRAWKAKEEIPEGFVPERLKGRKDMDDSAGPEENNNKSDIEKEKDENDNIDIEALMKEFKALKKNNEYKTIKD